MSRLYDFQIEVSPIPNGSYEAIVNVVHSLLGSFDLDGCDLDDYSSVWGRTTLFGGETDVEAHERFVGILRSNFPELESIKTYWRCIEYLNWDNQYSFQKE